MRYLGDQISNRLLASLLCTALLTLLIPLSPAQVKKQSVPADSGNSSFLPVRAYTFPDLIYPVFGLTADINGDGKLDIVVVNQCTSSCFSDGSVTVLLGNGDGTFYEKGTFDSGGLSPEAAAVGDINGDGKPDIIVLNNGQNAPFEPIASVGVMLGNGDGTFQPVVAYPFTGDLFSALVTGDLNGDGKLDVVFTGCVQQYGGCGGTNAIIGVMLGNGDGSLQPPVMYSTGGNGPYSAALVDINGDGKKDLVVTNTPLGIGVMLGNGDGTFQQLINLPNSPPPVPYFIVGGVADVNGDGKPDLLLLSCANSCSVGTVGVMLGNGDATFQAPRYFNSGGLFVNSVAVADVDGDGKSDLIVADCATAAGECGSFTPSYVGVLLGNGNGTFQPAVDYTSGGNWAMFALVGDFNGDGRPDVAVSNFSEPSIGILLNADRKIGSPTLTTLQSSLDPSVYGQTVTFTATVKSASQPPSGSVTFTDGPVVLGTTSLANGKAKFSFSSFVVGTHSITADYLGNSQFAHSTSAQRKQIVKTDTTTTSLVSSSNPVAPAREVTYTATVSSEFGEPATGRVSFEDDGITLGSAALSGNQASWTTSYTNYQVGIHRITATYTSDANNQASVSTVLREAIGKPPFFTETTLFTSGTPSTLGQAVTFTAFVTSKYGTVPDGELVTFFDGPNEIGTGTTSAQLATFTISTLTAGAHNIKAEYAGDTFLKPSGGRITQVVSKGSTTGQ